MGLNPYGTVKANNVLEKIRREGVLGGFLISQASFVGIALGGDVETDGAGLVGA